MVLLISYDLNGNERPRAYLAVKKVIEDNAVAFIKPLYSQWLVETDKNCKGWYELIEAAADNNESILVVRIFKGEYYGQAPKDTWSWLSERL